MNTPRAIIDELYADRMLPVEKYLANAAVFEPNDAPPGEPQPNEFVLMHDTEDASHTGLGRRLADTDHLIPVTGQKKPTFGIIARNVQQTMALDLLMDDDVKLITLLGSAGTGKTLLAIAAGMAKVFGEERLRQAARCAADHADGARYRVSAGRQGREARHVDAADLRQPDVPAEHAGEPQPEPPRAGAPSTTSTS